MRKSNIESISLQLRIKYYEWQILSRLMITVTHFHNYIWLRNDLHQIAHPFFYEAKVKNHSWIVGYLYSALAPSLFLVWDQKINTEARPTLEPCQSIPTLVLSFFGWCGAGVNFTVFGVLIFCWNWVYRLSMGGVTYCRFYGEPNFLMILRRLIWFQSHGTSWFLELALMFNSLLVLIFVGAQCWNLAQKNYCG